MDKASEFDFHPIVRDWFDERFGAPTACQAQAWPMIQSGRHTLVSAPTGSGKTLAAFLAVIDRLVRCGLESADLENVVKVLYVSPLKALSGDIKKNLEEPLGAINARLDESGALFTIQSALRTGDTTPSERDRIRKNPPHILVTTPESLYLLLTSDSGRKMLAGVETAIVDEVHALAGNKRGAHLSLSLARLDALCGHHITRVGLSATQKPMRRIARFLVGDSEDDVQIIDSGHRKTRDLQIEVTESPLTAVMEGEVWAEVYDRLATLVLSHRVTLIFVNTRRLAERVARHLEDRLPEDAVAAHHGSLSREHRLAVEQRLKSGELCAVVATGSLELGIDIGDVDLVCQIGSPRGISVLLQRVGRSGHGVDRIPKGRLFPTSRDELAECAALVRAIDDGELDTIAVLDQPLDVLAQQIVAEVSCQEWGLTDLYQSLATAHPYCELRLEKFQQVVEMLADGFTTRRGRRAAYLHYDAVHGRLKGRKGARLVALTNGGAIPDQFDYDVVLEPQGVSVGTLNEDFAFESNAGDVFQLGNASYRILRVEKGTVRVNDARGQPPNIPFWFGEAPGRSDELSQALSQLRFAVDEQLDVGLAATIDWLIEMYRLPRPAAEQLAEYYSAARVSLGTLPTKDKIIFERFFDDSGDMHLVIHSPLGSRINRAWGLALRKRFCRRFNFELQAAALEDSIVLSLGATHSFPLEEVAGYLSPATVREVLIQALLAAPMFPTRWRWTASIALAVKRNRNGKKIAPPLQRADAEDLVAVVFPDQLACLENIAGEREVPDHPLVEQAIKDCLCEVMDVDGLQHLLEKIVSKSVEILPRDLAAPSPLSQEILCARPYAFLDDTPAEERRTLAVQSRAFLGDRLAGEISRLDPDAINRVRSEAWPEALTSDELHDALNVLGYMTGAEMRRGGKAWEIQASELYRTGRATRLAIGEQEWVVAAERLVQCRAVHPDATLVPDILGAGRLAREKWERERALVELVRSRLEGLGPVTEAELAAQSAVQAREIKAALTVLEAEGFAVAGQFTGADAEWCERRLLARIHDYTLKRLRREIEPVQAAEFMRYLLERHRLTKSNQGVGTDALSDVIECLEGCEIPIAAWETEILPRRISGYVPAMLDELALSGWVYWTRCTPRQNPIDSAGSRPPRRSGALPGSLIRTTPLALLLRAHRSNWNALSSGAASSSARLSSVANAVADLLKLKGALFFDEIREGLNLLPAQLEQALSELVVAGVAAPDSFNGLRALLVPENRRRSAGRSLQRRTRRLSGRRIDRSGRWGLLDTGTFNGEFDDDAIEHAVWVLLRRYGVVFRQLTRREAGWLPPWRDLLRTLRRLEARGEIRGGRFVAGFTGEQFALPDVISALRGVRRRGSSDELVVVSAADPLNMTGILDQESRMPATLSNRVLYRNGMCVAVQQGDRVTLKKPADGLTEWNVKSLLLSNSASGQSRYVI